MWRRAKERVPVDTGALRDSGAVTLSQDGRRTVATISFGNDQVGYATIVHEDLEAQHDQGTAKFLEHALNEAAPDLARKIAACIDLKKS